VKRSFLWMIFILITGIALYSAAAGWVNAEVSAALKANRASEVSKPVIFENRQFRNEHALKIHLLASAERKWFPWMVDLPEPVALLVTALSFGLLGGVVRTLFDSIKNNVPLSKSSFGILLLSALMGLLMLGASYVIPAALTISETNVRLVALLFLCLIGGLFYDHMFSWLKKQFEKFLK
jgi:hypothetical protein